MDAETSTQIACPTCGKRMRAPARLAGRRVRCPGCQSVLDVPPPAPETSAADNGQADMAADSSPFTPDTPPPPPPPPTADTVTRFVFHPSPAGGRFVLAAASPPSRWRRSRHRRQVIVTLSVLIPLAVLFVMIDSPALGLMQPDDVHPIINRLRMLVAFLLSLTIFLGFWGGVFAAIARPYKYEPRQVHTRARYLLWLGPPALQLLVAVLVWIFGGGSDFLAGYEIDVQAFWVIMSSLGPSLPWLVGMYFLAPRIAPYLASLVTRCARCRRCRDLHDLVGVWSCSCGYHDYKPRHLLRFRCPLCKAMSGHFSCPHCETTILV